MTAWIVQWHRWRDCPPFDPRDFRRVVPLGFATILVPRADLAGRLQRHRERLAAAADRLRADGEGL